MTQLSSPLSTLPIELENRPVGVMNRCLGGVAKGLLVTAIIGIPTAYAAVMPCFGQNLEMREIAAGALAGCVLLLAIGHGLYNHCACKGDKPSGPD